jgi:hypothetical protein
MSQGPRDEGLVQNQLFLSQRLQGTYTEGKYGVE